MELFIVPEGKKIGTDFPIGRRTPDEYKFDPLFVIPGPVFDKKGNAILLELEISTASNRTAALALLLLVFPGIILSVAFTNLMIFIFTVAGGIGAYILAKRYASKRIRPAMTAKYRATKLKNQKIDPPSMLRERQRQIQEARREAERIKLEQEAEWQKFHESMAAFREKMDARFEEEELKRLHELELQKQRDEELRLASEAAKEKEYERRRRADAEYQLAKATTEQEMRAALEKHKLDKEEAEKMFERRRDEANARARNNEAKFHREMQSIRHDLGRGGKAQLVIGGSNPNKPSDSRKIILDFDDGSVLDAP